MTIAEWCVFGTLMLYLLTIASVKWTGHRHFDNARPRDPAFYEDTIRTRALGAHQNGIEAFPFFAAAVLLAEFRLGPLRLIDELARSLAFGLEHDPEKWAPVFRRDHAQTKTRAG